MHSMYSLGVYKVSGSTHDTHTARRIGTYWCQYRESLALEFSLALSPEPKRGSKDFNACGYFQERFRYLWQAQGGSCSVVDFTHCPSSRQYEMASYNMPSTSVHPVYSRGVHPGSAS